MKIKQAVILLSSIMLSSSVLATSQNNERWFDIEVILISQLANKDTLKEVFADDIKLPKLKKTLDLLTPYLTPDIAHLKQKLPFCDSKSTLVNYHEKVPKPSIVTIKSLSELASEVNDSTNNINNLTLYNENQTVLSEDRNESENKDINEETNKAINEQTESIQRNELVAQDLLVKEQTSEDSQALQTTNNELSTLVNEQALSPEQKALVTAAEAHFSPIKFNYTHSTDSKNSRLLCQITESEFDSLSPNRSSYSYLGYQVSSVPVEISASEDLYNDKPYLLNHDSLTLHDIVKQLKRSRDFRPVLHIGWRQPVSNRRNVIPVSLFAGDNLQQHYMTQLEQYQQQKAEVLAQEQSLNALLSSNNNNDLMLNEQEIHSENKKNRVNQIISQLPTVTNDTAELINEIAQPLTPLEIEQSTHNTLLLDPPVPPIQPWYLQGIMQIYINSNNRLNIIANFNMLNHTIAEQETIKLMPDAELELQTISFKQHRQVISTETHYFDHPYLGMIVQIRRHERPEPSDDNSTENDTINSNE